MPGDFFATLMKHTLLCTQCDAHHFSQCFHKLWLMVNFNALKNKTKKSASFFPFLGVHHFLLNNDCVVKVILQISEFD